MADRILLVDDDADLLAAFERMLRKHFAIDTAVGGVDGLKMFAQPSQYAVVVSDMRMPDLDGVQFLAKVREIAPETVRMMLTGNADLQTAMDAVNEGAIFRFLTKPCARETFTKALHTALEQHRLVTAERELLEKTLRGSVGALTEILAITNPIAFSRASRLHRLAHHMATRLALAAVWQIELAAMLSQIGCVTLVPETLEALYAGAELSAAEEEKYRAHPAVACKLLSNIPRLEAVAQIIAGQLEATAAPHRADPSKDRDPVAIGSQILRLALAFDELLNRGLSTELAVEDLLARPIQFDPALISSLSQFELSDANTEVRSVTIAVLESDMVFDHDVRAKNGVLLVAKGQPVTAPLKARLLSFCCHGSVPDQLRMRVPLRQSGSTPPIPIHRRVA